MTSNEHQIQSESKSSDFTPLENEFFAEGDRISEQPAEPVESFDDLDQGSERETFWQRVARGFGLPAVSES